MILAQYLVGLASGLPDQATQQDWAGALKVASQVARAAVLSPEEGTMLTVAQAALVALPSENFETYKVKTSILRKNIKTLKAI